MEIANILLRDGAQEGVVSGVKILIKEFRNNSMASQGLSHLQVMGEANHEQQSRLRYLRYRLFPSFAFLLQRSLHCCGAESFTDWEDSPWVLAQEKAKVRIIGKQNQHNLRIKRK